MATIVPTRENPVPGVVIYTWTPLTEADTGAAIVAPRHSDKCVHVTGSFGTGGSLRIEGTNDTGGTPTFDALSDPQGTTLDIVSADPHIEQVLENPWAIRPRVTAGTTVSLTVKLLVSTVRQ